MANFVSVADGNFNSSTPWGTVDAASANVATASVGVVVNTGNADSSTFVPANAALIGVCLKMLERGSGSPTNTMTVHLRNSTTGVNVKSVTVNVSDLPISAAGTDSEGGWIFLKFDSSHTPNGTDSYLIRATLSSTSTAVSLSTTTGSNLERLLVTSSTGTPGAGDDVHVMGVFDGATNPATTGTRTVTMDQTANTDYGSASTSQFKAAVSISTRGTLAFGTAGSTNYLLRVSGHVLVYRNGTFRIGSSGSEIPRTSTAQLEFDCASDGDFGLIIKTGGIVTMAGLSRTSGKNVVWTLLTADLAASGTASTVADDTGWLTGDVVGFAATTRTPSQREVVTLTGDAGASSLAHGAVTNAHGGNASTKVQAEVVLITRNVVVRSVTTTAQAFLEMHGSASLTASWALLRYLSGTGGSSLTTAALRTELTTGAVSLSYCCIADAERTGVSFTGTASGAFVSLVEHTTLYNCAIGIYTDQSLTAFTTPVMTFDDLVMIGTAAGSGANGFQSQVNFPGAMAVGAMRISSHDNAVILGGSSGSYAGRLYGPFNLHTNVSYGFRLAATTSRNLRLAAITAWRNSASGILFSDSGLTASIHFEGDVHCFGNVTAGIEVNSSQGDARDLRFLGTVTCSGDSSFAQGYGVFGSNNTCDFSFQRVVLGVATGIYVAHANADLRGNISTKWELGRAQLGSTTEIANWPSTDYAVDSYISLMRKDETTGVHQTITPLGTIARETSTVDVAPAALKMTPNVATSYAWRLESAARRRGRGYLVSVASGQAATVSVSVRVDGSYAGNAPRLILKANAAAGIASDVVLDTHSGTASVWEVLSGTTAAVDDDAVLEFVVDCNGTAGNAFVDSWDGGGDGSQDYWRDGLPDSAGAPDAGGGGSPGGGGGGGSETGFAHVG